MGIEPTRSAWKAEVLPLNYIRISATICIIAFFYFVVKIRSKPKANSRSDEQESHIRHIRGGRVCQIRQSPILPEPCGVNAADI